MTRSRNADRSSTPRPEDGGESTPTRRAPYSDNPTVGARGLRTQQRILDAAVHVFGEHGYERSSLDKIGQAAGCSRVSIYQYFSGKEDLFRHLAGQVARQLRASAEALGPVTPDLDGWHALRAWVARYADVHARYEPVFRAFGAAAQTDAELAGGSVRTGERNLAIFQSKLASGVLSPKRLAPVVALVHTGVNRSLDIASILRSASPQAYGRDRVDDAIADVVHRSLFGVIPEVNARPPAAEPPPALRIGDRFAAAFERADTLERESVDSGRRALASLLAVGQDVIVARGYQGARVDDVVEAAGVSHGTFYRYFENRDDLVQVVAVRALGSVSSALAELPGAADRTSLRRWLRRYNAVYEQMGAMIRIWTQAVEDPMRDDRAAVFDWGRRRLVRLCPDRDFGDVEIDAAILLSFIEVFGSMPREPVEVDAAVHVVEHGFLGLVR